MMASQLFSGTFAIPMPTSRRSVRMFDGLESMSQLPSVYSSRQL